MLQGSEARINTRSSLDNGKDVPAYGRMAFRSSLLVWHRKLLSRDASYAVGRRRQRKRFLFRPAYEMFLVGQLRRPNDTGEQLWPKLLVLG